jgi:hypothetical protein
MTTRLLFTRYFDSLRNGAGWGCNVFDRSGPHPISVRWEGSFGRLIFTIVMICALSTAYCGATLLHGRLLGRLWWSTNTVCATSSVLQVSGDLGQTRVHS